MAKQETKAKKAQADAYKHQEHRANAAAAHHGTTTRVPLTGHHHGTTVDPAYLSTGTAPTRTRRRINTTKRRDRQRLESAIVFLCNVRSSQAY
jgi:hypothetical protein